MNERSLIHINNYFFKLDSLVMDYFRAISRKEEYSERALKLTSEIISYNPAHYTIW